MRKLIKYELHKLFRQRSFYICGSVIILLPLIFLLITRFASGFSHAEITGWDGATSAMSNGNFIMIMGIFISLYICEDFDQGILKNIFSKGYSRGRVYAAKYFITLFAAGLIFLADMLVSFIVATVFWGTGSMGDSLETILCQGIVIVCYHAFFSALSFIIGKTGGSITLGIIIPMMMELVLMLADGLLKLKDFRIADYWIETLQMTATDPELSMKKHITASALMLVYTVVFYLLGLFFHRRKEV